MTKLASREHYNKYVNVYIIELLHFVLPDSPWVRNKWVYHNRVFFLNHFELWTDHTILISMYLQKYYLMWNNNSKSVYQRLLICNFISPDRQPDRQIFYWQKKSHYILICHRNERYICTCIYTIVNLLKSYDNIHGMTYTTKIMLGGIAKIITGYFDNINDYYLK